MSSVKRSEIAISRSAPQVGTDPSRARDTLLDALEEQLRFSARVIDVEIHPLLIASRSGVTELRADLLVSTVADIEGFGERITILVDDPSRPTARDRENRVRDWCSVHGVTFRMPGQSEIGTSYPDSVRRLAHLTGLAPDPQCRALASVHRHVTHGGTTQEKTVASVSKDGIGRLEAEDTIQRCVANGWFLCDLTKPYGPHPQVWIGTGPELASHRGDPLLRLVLDQARR